MWCTVVRCGESAALCVDQLPLLRRTAALPAAARCRASAAACCTPDLAAHGCVTAPADSISAAVGLATSCRTTSSRSSSCACGHSRAAVRAASLRPLRPAALRIVVLPVNGLRVVIHKSVACNKSLCLCCTSMNGCACGLASHGKMHGREKNGRTDKVDLASVFRFTLEGRFFSSRGRTCAGQAGKKVVEACVRYKLRIIT